MANILKCNQCNLVVDELLTFVQNKLDTMDFESLMQICVSAFTPSEIEKSKTLLFESVPTDRRKIKRKNVGKERRDMADIIGVFEELDPELIPVFVARNLDKLPPVTFDHIDVTSLLKDIVRLKSKVEEIKTSFVTREQLEAELSKMRGDQVNDQVNIESSFPSNMYVNVNKRRGRICAMSPTLDSGPMGLTNLHLSSYRGEE
ncbi:hypothetical protein NE865_07820 [Phthorimaea operculella]|nr:hypothetical protein NE865_07820 [Phthorimaea operculella]